MKKIVVALILGTSVLALAGCTKDVENNEKGLSDQATVVPVDLNTTSEPDQIETSESEIIDESLLPDDFDAISNDEKIIDLTSLVDVVTDCLTDIGVSAFQKVVWGNYREDSTSAVIDGFVSTDTNKKLLVDVAYEVNEKWSVMEVKDVDTENSYYVEDDLKDVIDLYDYKTGKRLENNKQTPKPTKKPTKKKKSHRKGMYGISKKDIHDIDGSFQTNKVRNDVTGKWRISTIAANVTMEKYALSYYKWKFLNDDEIHGIVNFNNKTTSKISVMGNMLDVTVHEYVKGEEHDANLLFSEMVLKEYHVYLENGDIKKIQ
ncbi:MAG: hypothetical protein K2K70_05940 [Lachnospiraceae bacterium]|nr:hypothetical protein [Lachnospiraceae bacterium]